jgi:hypothetical protein
MRHPLPPRELRFDCAYLLAFPLSQAVIFAASVFPGRFSLWPSFQAAAMRQRKQG